MKQMGLSAEGYSLIIPYFNEGVTISSTINEYGIELNKLNLSYEIIIVDDGSMKQAKEYLCETDYEYKLIIHRKNKGYGSAIASGIESSIYENIIITDSDNTYPAETISKMIQEYEQDIPSMVVAAREGRLANIPLIRRPAKFFLRKLASYLCEYNIRDLNSGLRIFKKDFYIKYKRLMPKRFSMTSTLTILAAMNDYNINYVKSAYRHRKGKSSISPIKDTYRFLNLILKLILLTDGMRVFLPSSILMILSSIILLILRCLGLGVGGATSVILFCTGLQLLSFGALCKCINYSNERF